MSAAIAEAWDGIWRVTFALPLGIDHVHCYLVRSGDDGLTVVDTGLGVEGAAERWREVLARFDATVRRIVITHFHPDHVGAAADVAAVTNAPVYQGRLDYEQCVRTWGAADAPARVAAYLRAHGMPADNVATLRGPVEQLRRYVRFVRDPELLEPGDRIHGWEILHLPGHADGHLCLVRDGVMIAGDALLATISPNVGLYPDARPDPLGDYLSSLARIAETAPVVALPGHGDPIHDPAARARELISHHEQRLESTLDALRRGPRNAYEISLALFPEPLSPMLRRFALAEARAHLERLVLDGRVERITTDEESTAYALA